MKTRDEIRMQFFNESDGDYWSNNKEDPDIDYVYWLEDRLINKSTTPVVENWVSIKDSMPENCDQVFVQYENGKYGVNEWWESDDCWKYQFDNMIVDKWCDPLLLASVSTNEIEQYLFNEDQYGNCLEKCNVLNNGTMIGSVKCQECKHCVSKDNPCEFTGNVAWIVCSKLNEAKGLLKEGERLDKFTTLNNELSNSKI